MSESNRQDGTPENPYQDQYFGHEWQQQAHQPQQPQAPQSAQYDPAAATAAPAPTAPQPVFATASPALGGTAYPPPPSYQPTALLQAPTAPEAPRRAKRPVALLAAVAIIAAAIGGGTAATVESFTGSNSSGTSTTVAAASGTTVAASSKGTIAGVAAAVSPAIVEISATSSAGQSTGSGVVITADGEIVTNNHVVSGASTISVTLSTGKKYTAKVVGTDADKDLALIKLENASGLTTATLGDSSAVAVGDEVVAIGSPEGLTGTVTSGIISALNRDVTVAKDETQSQGQSQNQYGGGSSSGSSGGSGDWPFQFGGQQFNGDTGTSTTTYKALQTDASLNPGNSGGALINMNGEIVGINSAMYSPSSSSSSSAGSVGLGFAIPINTVKADLATLRAGGSSS
jgi:putative serine protease PepD